MIKISERFYIDADSKNYTLKEKAIIKSKDGQESEGFKEAGYYSTLEGLFNGILKTELREFIASSNNVSIEELLRKLKELESFFREKLKEV